MRAIYRVRQGLANLGARMQPEDWDLVGRHLSPAERALFERMQPADQLHSVRVLRTLLDAGTQDGSLLKAALLHDVGKSRCQISVLHRTAAVLMEAISGGVPAFLLWQPDGGWWMPFHVIANHARIGASMLASAGCDERVWRLVELHQSDPLAVGGLPDGEWVRRSLVALRQADNQN